MQAEEKGNNKSAIGKVLLLKHRLRKTNAKAGTRADRKKRRRRVGKPIKRQEFGIESQKSQSGVGEEKV